MPKTIAVATNWRETLCKCKQCGWPWLPRKNERPQKCPRCRSVKWEATNGHNQGGSNGSA